MIDGSSPPDVQRVLAQVAAGLHLSAQTERELLEEIRTHLEDAVEDAVARGADPAAALEAAARRFGVDDVAAALQEEHAPWESADAIVACMLPVAGALLLRWLAFAPAGSAAGWAQLLLTPALWIVAVVVLSLSAIYYHRWQYAMVVWGFFWTLTLLLFSFGTAAAAP